MLVVSWTAAIVACLAYGTASILQSVGAQRVASATGMTGIAAIVRQLPYVAGLGLDGVGFVANVVALQLLPLFLVQSIVAASVGVTAVIAVFRGAVLGWKDWASLAVLGLGLVLVSATAVEGPAARLHRLDAMIILGLVVLPLLVGLVGLRTTGRASAITLSVAAGLGFSGVVIASRGLDLRWGWHLVANPLLWAVALYGAVAIAFFGVALQRGSVTVVTAITFVIEVIVPATVGVLLFRDAVGHDLAPVAVLGLLLAVLGTISLARFTPSESPTS